MTIGARIREERNRLTLNQTDCAAIAGTTKKTLIEWEANRTAPTALQLAALTGRGFDAQFIVTGQRSSSALDAMEAMLLEAYRKASDGEKKRILGAALGFDGLTAGVTQTSHGSHAKNIGSIVSGETPKVI